MIVVRWLVSVALAVCITGGLFYFMQYLIATGERFSEPINVIRIVDATMPDIELDVIEEVERPEPIEEIVQNEPEADEREFDPSSGPSLAIVRTDVDIGGGIDLTPATISTTDGDYLPLVAIAPQYPTRAAQRGIEGWCLVNFTVDALGNVVEDSIVVVDSEPPNIFDRSSVRAAARFKFQPRVINGKGVEVPRVPYVFRYVLSDDE